MSCEHSVTCWVVEVRHWTRSFLKNNAKTVESWDFSWDPFPSLIVDECFRLTDSSRKSLMSTGNLAKRVKLRGIPVHCYQSSRSAGRLLGSVKTSAQDRDIIYDFQLRCCIFKKTWKALRVHLANFRNSLKYWYGAERRVLRLSSPFACKASFGMRIL